MSKSTINYSQGIWIKNFKILSYIEGKMKCFREICYIKYENRFKDIIM